MRWGWREIKDSLFVGGVGSKKKEGKERKKRKKGGGGICFCIFLKVKHTTLPKQNCGMPCS